MYNEQEYDFINRTKIILKQYENVDFSDMETGLDKKYDVTLFINCFVGMLITPQQNWFYSIPETKIENDESWHIKQAHIKFLKKGEEPTINVIVKHLRNSVSHANFIMLSKKNNPEITHIEFKDYLPNSETLTFKAEINISALKNFILKFNEEMLKIILADKPKEH
jgi:hypothetical protein